MKRGKITFEICGAPFGTGFFVSTRIIEFPYSQNIFARIWRWLFAPTTFYRLDTIAMYKLAVENAVSEAVQELMNGSKDKLLDDSRFLPPEDIRAVSAIQAQSK